MLCGVNGLWRESPPGAGSKGVGLAVAPETGASLVRRIRDRVVLNQDPSLDCVFPSLCDQAVG